MKKVFPEMMECLHGGYIVGIGFYWLICFVFLPFVLPVIGFGIWEDSQLISWFECGYYIINGLVLAAFLKEHLSYTWFQVTMEKKDFLQTVAIAVGLMLAWVVLSALVIMELFGSPYDVVNIFPISEMGVALTPGWLVMNNPILGTICLSVFVPFSVTALFYATAFAPVCCKTMSPWLAYVAVSLVLLLPTLFDIFWREGTYLTFLSYFLRLPVHWFACWTYQRTDTVWAPVVSLAAMNLVMSVVCIVVYQIFPA